MSTVAREPLTNAGSQPVVLALNSGSSSLKFGLYRVSGSRSEELLSGTAEAIGEQYSEASARRLAASPGVIEGQFTEAAE